MSDIDSIINLASQEFLEGRKWRAKELLQSALGRLRYPQGSNGEDTLSIYNRLGQVLTEMGDDVEAGKYLFLSGQYTPDESNAVSLFIDRYGKRNAMNIYWTFPKLAQLSHRSQYPEKVRNTLSQLGISEDLPRKHGRHEQTMLSWKQKIGLFSFLAMLVLPWIGGIIAFIIWIL